MISMCHILVAVAFVATSCVTSVHCSLIDKEETIWKSLIDGPPNQEGLPAQLINPGATVEVTRGDQILDDGLRMYNTNEEKDQDCESSVGFDLNNGQSRYCYLNYVNYGFMNRQYEPGKEKRVFVVILHFKSDAGDVTVQVPVFENRTAVNSLLHRRKVYPELKDIFNSAKISFFPPVDESLVEAFKEGGKFPLNLDWLTKLLEFNVYPSHPWNDDAAEQGTLFLATRPILVVKFVEI